MVAWNKNFRKNVMKTNNQYFLLRHGQTIYQKENRKVNYTREENPFLTLTEEGKKMIENSTKTLKDKNINLIFASPYERAKQSAIIVSKMIGVDNINYDNRIIDIDLGKFMGGLTQDSEVFYSTGSFDSRPDGGESWNDILKRVREFLEELETKYKGQNILIVSHADPIWLMAGYLRGYKNEEEFLESRKDTENSYPKLAQLIKV